MKKILKWLSIILSISLISYGLYFFTFSYQPTAEAQAAFTTATVEETKDWLYFPGAETNDNAIIIYQGARVAAKAYTPLARELQQRGYHVFITKMPFNWAFLNSDVATAIENSYPQLQNFYLGGHSLGGVIASSYVADHLDNPQNKGLFFLASYPANDFNNTTLPMLGIFGSNDGFVDAADQTTFVTKASTSPYTNKIVISGANHSQIGSYGFQKGDEQATITADAQQLAIADALDTWIQQIN